MNKNQTAQKVNEFQDKNEKGQSIVLIAFALVGILAFAGIAIDVGFIFARGSQLQAAVDAAALAAVTELTGGTINDADIKAGQFLNANNIPVATTILKNNVPITTTMISSTGSNPLGETQYSLTVTWPVELYFLKFIDFENTSWTLVNLTRSATAAYFPQADIYASRRVESGVLSTSNQSLFGPHACTSHGDPFSPLVRKWPNSEPPDGTPYTYHYRILIPNDYPSDILRVELFDPDSINQSANSDTVQFSAYAISDDPIQYPLAGKSISCSNTDQKDPCLLVTGEGSLVDPVGPPVVTLDQVNPFWFVRIDENRGSGSAPGNPNNCGQPSSYDPDFMTSTLYELFYFSQDSSGNIQRVDLARYTGQVNDGVRDNGDHQTDMHWVSPGGTRIYDQLADVPLDPGSPTTNSGNGFELSLSQDVPGIVTDPASGTRYVFLDVTAKEGGSENGFEVWAGPWYPGISSNVNTRNIQVLNDPTSHSAQGATIFGMGRLPMNSNFDNEVNIPLIYVGPELAGQSIFVSLFDTDAGAQPPIVFFFDSIAFTPNDAAADGVNWAKTDWAMSFGGQNVDPDGHCYSGPCPGGLTVRTCKPGSCHDEWVTPSYEIIVPGNLDNCDYNNPTQEDCTPFYGGRLTARYTGGEQDTYGWQINVTGLPYLIR